MAGSESKSLLKPILGGLAVLAALVGAIYFRAELWALIKKVGSWVGHWMTEWVPDHPGATVAIVGFGVLAFVVNWFAHVRGRLRAWIFAIVVEVGLWLLFWYGAGIPSFNELFGLNLKWDSASRASEILFSGLAVIAITGVLFWFLEAREEWNKYRRRHHVDED